MKIRKIPERTCISCRMGNDKRQLIRIVRCPSGDIVLDQTGKLSGRGAYICNSADCIQKAIKDKKLFKALRTEVPEEALRQLEKKLIQGSDNM